MDAGAKQECWLWVVGGIIFRVPIFERSGESMVFTRFYLAKGFCA